MNAAYKINARFGCLIVLAMTCQTKISTLPSINRQTLADATSMAYQYAADNPGKALTAGIFGTAWLIYRTGRCRGFSSGYPEGVKCANTLWRYQWRYQRPSNQKTEPENTPSPEVKQDQSTLLKIGTLGMWYIYHLGRYQGYNNGNSCGRDDWVVSTKCSNTSFLRDTFGNSCCRFHNYERWCIKNHRNVPKNSGMGNPESGKSTWPRNPFMALYHFCWKR